MESGLQSLGAAARSFLVGVTILIKGERRMPAPTQRYVLIHDESVRTLLPRACALHIPEFTFFLSRAKLDDRRSFACRCSGRSQS